jgi:cytochrome c
MRYLVAAAVFVLFLIAPDGLSATRAQDTGTPQQPSAASAEVPAKIPPEERNRKNPVPPVADSIEYGRLIFSSQCTMCHGATGDGKGKLAKKYEFGLPDFTEPATQARRTDGELFYILTHGHGKMTGEGDRLKDKVKWDIVNYIRSLSKS